MLYEVVETGFTRMVDLALAEIKYIRQFKSYPRGLNSTPGGDGLGRHLLTSMTEDEILTLRSALGVHWARYNEQKWSGLSDEERKKLSAHLHTPEVYEKKSKTLKKYYEANPEAKADKGKKIKEWQEKNKETVKANNRVNGLKGAAKVSKELSIVTGKQIGKAHV